MKKFMIILTGLLLSVFMTAQLALAQDTTAASQVTAQSLQEVLPANTTDLTRADFMAMLVKAAGTAPGGFMILPKDVPTDAWYQDALKSAMKAGIISGYTDGTIHPDDLLTRSQAMIFIYRAMGLPDSPAPNTAAPVPAGNPAYVPYTWLIHDGFLTAAESPDGNMTVSEAADLLAKIYGTQTQARDLINQAQAAMQKLNTFKADGTANIGVQAVPGAALPNLPGPLEANLQLAMEINKTQGFKEDITLTSPLLPKAMNIEEYLLKDGIYMKVPDPTTGAASWTKLPADTTPIFNLMMNQKLQAVSPALNNLFYSRLAGEKTIDGKVYDDLVMSGRIKDFSQILNLIGTALDEQTKTQLQQQLSQAGNLISGMTIQEELYLDKDSLMPDNEQMSVVVNFNNQLNGQPVPFKSFNMTMNMKMHDFNTGFTVKLPADATNIKTLDQPTGTKTN